MTSNELKVAFENISETLSRSSAFTHIVNMLSSKEKEISRKLADLIEERNPDLLSENQKDLNNLLRECIGYIEDVSIRDVFLASEMIIKNLIDIKIKQGNFNVTFSLLGNRIEDFIITFSAFLQSRKSRTLIVLINQAKKVEISLTQTESLIAATLKSLSYNFIYSELTEPLHIYFKDEVSIEGITSKLRVLLKTYNEVCFLLNVSTAEYPLKIVKIETGSLLAIIAGYVKSIGFMKWFLTESTKFTYRNYTTEGKFKEIGNKIEFYDKALDFTGKLKEFGIDTEADKEKIAKGFSTLIDQANELVEGQSKIKIDNTEISMEEEIVNQIFLPSKQKFIEEGQQKALPPSDDEGESDGLKWMDDHTK